jgi:hypothetical protein
VIELPLIHLIEQRRGRLVPGLALAFAAALLAVACSSKQSTSDGTGGVTGGAAGDSGTGPGGGTGGGGSGGGVSGGGTGGVVGTGVGGHIGVGGMGVGGHTGVGGAMAACQPPIPITTGTAATVTADLGTLGQTVSPDLMGVHTSVYDSNMQLASTIGRLRDAGVKSLRYPGGSYSDLYHWELNTGTATPASGVGGNNVYIAQQTDFGSFIGFMERVQANALITVNYGMNPTGTGPGVAQEAAAWVAYANGSPTNTKVIGLDADGKDWFTVGYWAGLRAATPLAVDDGKNFLRVNHPAPVGIKYWEIGNELYGNGFYYGGCGWEADLHVPYPASSDSICTGGSRLSNTALSPVTYGNAVKAYAAAMKAVDPTIKVGGIVAWPTVNQYRDWNDSVLTPACASMDFAVLHWYAGPTLTGLLTAPETQIPGMFKSAPPAPLGVGLRQTLATAKYACAPNLPIAITEWGPNTLPGVVVVPPSTPTAAPVGSQILGLFAVESYANFMEQGALAVHWLELHNESYLAGVNPAVDPFTVENDSPRWGYHGQLIAHFLASGNDKMATATVTNAGALQGLLKAHASLHADGSVSVMVTNTSATIAGNVNVAITGGATALSCVGVRYAYTPVNNDQDGDVTSAYIFAAADGLSVPVAVPAYSTVVVSFPKK